MGPSQASTRKRPRSQIRIFIIDEKGILRDGLCALLATVEEFDIIGTESTAADGLRAVVSTQPDVVIAGFGHLKMDEQHWIAQMKARCPGSRVLLLNPREIGHRFEKAVRAGADGILLKTDGCNELFTAVRTVAAGRFFANPIVAKRTERADGSPAEADSTRDIGNTLSEREKQVIRLIAQGHRTREIAKLLSLSHKTIEKHRTSLMRKLGLRNASAVAAYATAHGLA
jgi:two-component system, NarL family, response regulator NreC